MGECRERVRGMMIEVCGESFAEGEGVEEDSMGRGGVILEIGKI